MKNYLNLSHYLELPNNFYKLSNIYLIIATLGGIGYAKKAPGTVGSLATLIVMVALSYLGHSFQVIVATLSVIIGFYACEKVYTPENEDPSFVVIDEFAGMALSLLLVHDSILLSLLAFVIFRILDITKPWIIGMAERTFPRGVAIMMDDIIAGFVTLLIVTAISIFIS